MTALDYILVGSFLPNNLSLWLVKRYGVKIKRFYRAVRIAINEDRAKV